MNLNLEVKKEKKPILKSYSLNTATREKIRVYHKEDDNTYYLELDAAYKLGYMEEEEYNERKKIGKKYYWIPYNEVLKLKEYYDIVIIPFPKKTNNLSLELSTDYYKDHIYQDDKTDKIKDYMDQEYNKIDLDDSINIHK